MANNKGSDKRRGQQTWALAGRGTEIHMHGNVKGGVIWAVAPSTQPAHSNSILDAKLRCAALRERP